MISRHEYISPPLAEHEPHRLRVSRITEAVVADKPERHAPQGGGDGGMGGMDF